MVMRIIWDVVLIVVISSLAWLAGFNFGWNRSEWVTLTFNPSCTGVYKSVR
jgi:hypothetical protein